MTTRESQPPSLGEQKKLVKHLVNVLQSFKKYYAFVTRREGPAEGPWHVVAGCISQRWMDQVWEELKAHDDLGGRLLAALDGRAFHDAYPQMDPDGQQLARDCWTWFIERSRSRTSPPEIALLDMLVPEAWATVTRGEWYLIELTPPIDDATVEERGHADAPKCYFTVDLPDDPYEREPVVRQCVAYERLSEERGDLITQSTIRALHHAYPGASLGNGPREPPAPPVDPQPVPDKLATGPDEVEPAVVVPVPRRGVVTRTSLVDDLLDRLGEAWRRLATGTRARLDQLLAGYPVGMELAVAGGAPLFYIGSPAPGAGAAQRPNPMVVAAPQQAFVGVLDIGQGNCNPIYDSDHTIVAYYDIGKPWGPMASSFSGNRAAPGGQTHVVPCLCSRPLIILSHWDEDHWKFGNDNESAHSLSWLAPEQDYSPKGTVLVGRIASGGGTLFIWSNARAADHMRFPWGWVERCSAAPANLNGSGLAAFVCLRDDPAVVRMQEAVAAVPGLLVGPLANGGAATTERYARPVAAALAGATAVDTTRVAHAVVRATVAAVSAPVAATEDALTAFISRGDGAAALVTAALGLVNGGLIGSLPAVVSTAVLSDPNARLTARAVLTAVAAGAGIPAQNAARAVAAATPFAVNAACVEAVSHPMIEGGGIIVPPTRAATATKTRDAAAAVDAMVAALVGAPAHTLVHAKTVAAALGSSNSGVFLSAVECARAAVRATVGVLGAGGRPDAEIGAFISRNDGGAAPVSAALTVLNVALVASLPAHVGPPNFSADTLLVTSARASVAAGQVAARHNAAGAYFFAPRGYVQAAVDPAPLLELRAGLAPHAPLERYAFLNADANFDVVRSLADANPPPIVTLTAMHHGSYFEDGLFMANSRIPWAPSAAAADPGTAAVASAGHCAARAVASYTNTFRTNAGALALPGLAVAVTHAGAAAAAAVYGVRRMNLPSNAQNLVIGDNNHRTFAALTAAAVLSSLSAPTEAGVVAVTAVMAAMQREGAGSAYDYARLGQLICTRLRAGDLQGQIVTAAATAFPYLDTRRAGQVAASLGALAVCNHDNIRDLSFQARQAAEIGPSLAGALAELASAAWTAAGAGNNRGDEMGAVVAAKHVAADGLAAAVATVMAMEITTPNPGGPVDARRVARYAAENAILGEAQRVGQRPYIQLSTAYEALASGSAAAAARAVGVGAGSGPIAYSYGVKANNRHCYLADTLGNLGHPHPLAIEQYIAHGWTERRNTCAIANHGAAQTDNVSPRGHVALGWDYANDVPLTRLNAVGNRGHAGTIPRGQLRLPACPTCNQLLYFNL